MAYKSPQEAEADLTKEFNPGGDANVAAAVKQAASLVPGNNPTPSPYYPRYTAKEQAASNYLETFTAPKSEADIIADKTAAAQGQIDSLRSLESSLLAEQRVINEGRNRSTASVNTLSGLAGSTEANVQVDKTNVLNQKDNERIKNQISVQIQGILGNIRASAVEEAKQSRLEARQSAEAILANRTKRQEEAVNNLTLLAKSSSGATLAGLKASMDPKEYDFLVRNAGGEAMAQAILFENRPRNQILGTPQLIGGKMVQAFQSPDGKILYESVDLPDGVTPDRIQSVEKTDNGIFIINKDGTYSRIAGSGKVDGGGAGDQLYSGLSSATATAVRSKVGKFGTEPGVQNFATIQEGYNFAQSLSDTTTNPADDQALIYSLAKALDPGSVVREGEYATAQKYAQSWVKAFGTGVTQAALGTGFLSQEARKNIKTTIKQRFTAAKSTYDQTTKSYVSNINSLTGRGDGDKFLTDYAVPISGPRSSVIVKDGQSFDASALTEEEYNQAIADGYEPQ